MQFEGSRWTKSKILQFTTYCKSIDVTRNDIGEYMKSYAEENDLLKQPQQMTISSFNLNYWTLITPLFKFYLELGLQCTKINRFLQKHTACSTVSFSLLLMLGESVIKIHYLVW